MLKLIVAVILVIGTAGSAAAVDFVCNPTEVGVFRERIHVRCAHFYHDGAQSIEFWAVETTDVQWADRFFSTATTALVSGRQLVLGFTPGDTSGALYGCRAEDCRKPFVIRIL